MKHSLWLHRLITLGIAVTGVGVFVALGLPLPFLFGPMCCCLIAALAGLPLSTFGQVTVSARSILGVAIGASVTPALMSLIPQMIASLVLVPFYIGVIALIGVPFFRKFCGFDQVTAFYAAMPGGAADMTLFGQEAGGNTRQLSLVHMTRLMVIMVLAPLILVNLYGVTLGHPIGQPAQDIPIVQLLIMAVAALVGWKGAERIGLFGAAIMGPLLLCSALSLAGILQMRPPREALLGAQFLIGAGIGASYVGVTLKELRETVLGGAVFVLILAALAGAVTEIVTLAGLVPPVEAFLSFTPGGQAEMSMLALITGADLSFVVAHHLLRIFTVILGAPILFRWLNTRKP